MHWGDGETHLAQVRYICLDLYRKKVRYIYLSTAIYLYIDVYLSRSLSIYIYIHIYICMHRSMYIYIYIYLSIYLSIYLWMGDVSGYTWRAHEGKVSALCIGGAENRTLVRYEIYVYIYIYTYLSIYLSIAVY